MTLNNFGESGSNGDKSYNRPRIPRDIHVRAASHVLDESRSPNRVYIDAIKLMYEKNGDHKDWARRLNVYCEENNVEPDDVLNAIFSKVFSEDGEANVQFKSKLKLDDVKSD